jgi:hypothetical protein
MYAPGPTTLRRLLHASNICFLATACSLAHFRVHNNALTGEIPANIGETWRLESLFLHENKLEGAIPESIGSLHDLSK